jgi:hypothetical protein
MSSFELSLNGEPASPEDLQTLETLATDLLIPVSAEYYREYGYATPNDSYVLIGTCLSEEELELGTSASITIGKYYDDGDSDTKLAVTFGYDNQLTDIYEDNDEFEKAITIAEDLLVNAELMDPVDINLIRHLRDWAVISANGSEHGRLDLFHDTTEIMEVVFTGDIIRKRVIDATEEVLRTKKWGLALNEDHILQIESNEFMGGSGENATLDIFPLLEIKYDDRERQVTYLYTKGQNGQITLQTFSGHEYLDSEELDAFVEEEIDEFLDELKVNDAGKHDVLFLIDRVMEANLVEAS